MTKISLHFGNLLSNLQLADGALLLLTVLFYSYFDLSWHLMTSEDAENLRVLLKSSKEPTAG